MVVESIRFKMRLILKKPGAGKILAAIALNQAKRLRLLRRQRGGHRVLSGGIDSTLQKCTGDFERISAAIGIIEGKKGLEIGPGDNLGLADFFLAAGAKSMNAVEQFPTVQWSEDLHRRIWSRFGRMPDGRPELHVGKFEESSLRDLDFIYSIDVMEHVADPRQVIREAFKQLKPGGMFINAVDFSGHNAFSMKSASLNFLACEDWLYDLMHSHIVTSNRCRPGEFIDILRSEGFLVTSVVPTRQADDDYVRQVRPHLLPRFRDISVPELALLEAMIVSRKPPGDGLAS